MEDFVVLVTGGSGFLGQHVIKHLQILGRNVKEIRVLDVRKYEQKLDFEAKRPVKSYVGSVADRSLVKRACTGVNVVMHIASFIDWRMFPDYKALHEVNVKGTETVLNACKEQNVSFLIYCSSMSVYYGPEEVVSGTETTVKPPSKLYFKPYSLSKIIAQKMILEANGFQLKNGKKLHTVAILPVGMFGELDTTNITNIIRPFKEGKKYIPSGPMKALVHYCYAGNTAVMFVKAMEGLERNPDIGGEIFFAADDTPPDTIPGIIKPFFDQFNIKITSWHIPYWLMSFLLFVVYWALYVVRFFKPVELANLTFTFGSIAFVNTTFHVTYDKAKTLLGYTPLYDYKTSVKKSLQFYTDFI